MPERPAGTGLYWAASSDRRPSVVKHHACQADWSRLTPMQVINEDAGGDDERGRIDRAAPAAIAPREGPVAARARGPGRQLRVRLTHRRRPATPVASRDQGARPEARRLGAVPRDRLDDDERGGPRDPALGRGAPAQARRVRRRRRGGLPRRPARGERGRRRRRGDPGRARARPRRRAGGAKRGGRRAPRAVDRVAARLADLAPGRLHHARQHVPRPRPAGAGGRALRALPRRVVRPGSGRHERARALRDAPELRAVEPRAVRGGARGPHRPHVARERDRRPVRAHQALLVARAPGRDGGPRTGGAPPPPSCDRAPRGDGGHAPPRAGAPALERDPHPRRPGRGRGAAPRGGGAAVRPRRRRARPRRGTSPAGEAARAPPRPRGGDAARDPVARAHRRRAARERALRAGAGARAARRSRRGERQLPHSRRAPRPGRRLARSGAGLPCVGGAPPRGGPDRGGLRGAGAGRRPRRESLGGAARDPLGSAFQPRQDGRRMPRVAAPLHLALRRLRERLFVVAATAAAVGGAGALIGWSSLAAADAQERNVHLHLRALPPAKRAVRVVYTTAPLQADRHAAPVQSALATAPLEPDRVHGSELRALVERLRREIVRLDRSDSPGVVTATAPLPFLTALADRGSVARRRLLLVASEGAALVLAFAAFTATARRREVAVLEEQLATLGASRGQIWLARATEALVPSAAGRVLTLGGLLAAGHVPLGTVLAIVVTTAVAALLLVAAGAPRPPRLRFVGPLETGALAALGVIVWQTASTGSLDPAQIAAAHRASPILLLVPALAFFASAVLLLRLLPILLRLAERAARTGSIGVRLAALGAARRPAQAAAVTTFLAVALGAALFSLDYRATLDRNARDQAEFAAGAAWRVVGARSVLAGAPALRFQADVAPALPSSSDLPVALLGVGAGRLPEVRGWRAGFSPLARSEIAHRLRPRPIELRGPKPAEDATALRVWIRADTQYPRIVVLHLLLRGRTFAHVRAGVAWTRWRRLEVPVPARLRGAQLVGVEFLPTFVPLNHELDLSGSVELGRFEERRPGGWSPLPPLRTWTAAAGETGGGYLITDAPFEPGAPVRQGLQLSLNGTATPLLRPAVGLPRALPALVSPSVAAQAVDGELTVDLEGRELPVRVAAVATRFPTVLRTPDDFLVLDYDTLFAALNADRPGFAST